VLPAGAVSHQMAITMDLTVSMANAAGVRPARGRAFDGIDILRHVADGTKNYDRTLYWRARRGERTWRAVRDGNLKYLSRQDGDEVQEWLFDLAADPKEANDLKPERPEDFQRLKRLLAAWEKEVRHKR
jgi:N-acetylgalactosamine-6-sulfatase